MVDLGRAVVQRIEAVVRAPLLLAALLPERIEEQAEQVRVLELWGVRLMALRA